MKISKPLLKRTGGNFIFETRIETKDGIQTLWYSVDEAFSELVARNSDAPLVGLLIIAMANSEDIFIEGNVSQRLLYNLNGTFQILLKKIIPSLNFVKIYPNEVYSNYLHRASGVATGFSGGIDSFCVLADHYYGDISDDFKITHLLFNNVGSHFDGEALFYKRFKRLVPVVKKIGLPFIAVNSNLDSFYKNKYNFLQTHTLRNLSIALLLQQGIGRFMYAAAYSYNDIFVGETEAIAKSDLVTLPMLSTERLDAFSVGSEYTRVEKTIKVSEITDSFGSIDVCVNPRNAFNKTNCSVCWKCLRTLTTLDIAGKLNNYSESFDLDEYMKVKNIYLSSIYKNKNAFAQEIAQYADDVNYSFPLSAKIMSYLKVYPIAKYLRKKFPKLKKIFR